VNIKASLIAAAIATTAIATPAFAWTELGVRDVADRTDHDTIRVGGYRDFNHIRLCVYRNPIRMYDLHVRFGNGRGQDVSVRDIIGPGQCTRAIDLNGRERHIDRIDMTYEETSWHRATATVRVFGE
jgi:hypothetical protein